MNKPRITATQIVDYRGWKLYYDPDGPVTGKYRALRYGVGMGASTLEMLQSMIDNRLNNEVKTLKKEI